MNDTSLASTSTENQPELKVLKTDHEPSEEAKLKSPGETEAPAQKWYRIDRATIAILISVLALTISVSQYRLQSRLAFQHLFPEISTQFIFPSNGDPTLALVNRGDIPAASISVKHEMYVFDKQQGKVIFTTLAGNVLNRPFFFVNEMTPNDLKTMGGMMKYSQLQGTVQIYVFHVQWYRAKDMEEKHERVIYFVDDGKVLDHPTFKAEAADQYETIMRELDKPLPATSSNIDPDQLKQILEALTKAQPIEKQ